MGDGALAKSIGSSPYLPSSDHTTYYTVETGLRGYSDEEKQRIGISTISVVARLALEFQVEEVLNSISSLTCS